MVVKHLIVALTPISDCDIFYIVIVIIFAFTLEIDEIELICYGKTQESSKITVTQPQILEELIVNGYSKSHIG